MEKQIIVEKRDGTKEPFEPEKLRRSLTEAEAPEEVIDEIVDEIIAECDEETTTDIIYERAFTLLKEKRNDFAARYSLRQALAELGPTGYPFEKFVSHILAAKGYQVTVSEVIQGKCTTHEMDVVAEKDDELILVEAKFHNSRSLKSSLQTPLYVKARLEDLEAGGYGHLDSKGKKVSGWLITNTKFSSQAIEYGECAGINMVGWGYPKEGNLEDLIDETTLHPVTALSSLSGAHKQELTKQGVVLCRTLREEKDKLEALGFNKEKVDEVLEEVDYLCYV